MRSDRGRLLGNLHPQSEHEGERAAHCPTGSTLRKNNGTLVVRREGDAIAESRMSERSARRSDAALQEPEPVRTGMGDRQTRIAARAVGVMLWMGEPQNEAVVADSIHRKRGSGRASCPKNSSMERQ